MGAETSEWYNTMTLQGFTDMRGHAWHYMESAQGSEPNHYPMAIPREDVVRRLFYWEPSCGTSESTYVNADGQTVRAVWEGRQTIVHPYTGHRLGEFTDGYVGHSYREWLLDVVLNAVDDPDLGISSAGLLKQGGQAWVQFQLPESLNVSGIVHRPFITASTSLDGSLATKYIRGTQLVVCDNTLSMALAARDTLKTSRRHTKYSKADLPDIRNALEIMYETGDEISQGINDLLEISVTEDQWQAFLTEHFGQRPTEKGAGQTRYDNRRADLDDMYHNDERVAPWQKTGFGVVQSVNTMQHHGKTVHGDKTRGERNMEAMVKNEFAKLDAETLKKLNAVLASV